MSRFNFIWTISNFSFCCEDEVLKSSVFSPKTKDNLGWCLHLNPNCEDEEAEGHLSVYLSLVSSNMVQVRAAFKLSLRNGIGEQIEARITPRAYRFVPNQQWGFTKFIQRDFLLDKSKNLLPDDQLSIFCEMIVLADHDTAFQVPSCQLSPDMGSLLDHENFSDVVLVVGKKEIRAHKAILAARSPVFAAMFELDTKEKCFVITDVSPEVLTEMLSFIYTGKVQNLRQMARNLLAAADQYDLCALKTMCEKALCTTLTVERAASLLVLADLHRADGLKTQVLEYISTHASRVTETFSWNELVRSYPYLAAEAFRVLALRQARLACSRGI